MTNLEKHYALCEYLVAKGCGTRESSLRVSLRLRPQDGWIEFDVTRLWEHRGTIYYSTPSFRECTLSTETNRYVANSAYLYDQLINRDKNLF